MYFFLTGDPYHDPWPHVASINIAVRPTQAGSQSTASDLAGAAINHSQPCSFLTDILSVTVSGLAVALADEKSRLVDGRLRLPPDNLDVFPNFPRNQRRPTKFEPIMLHMEA